MAQALKVLKSISERRIKGKLFERIQGLERDPEMQGKPLLGGLSPYRSLRAIGQRYRIIYRIEQDIVQVLVVTFGMRKEKDKKDIYVLAGQLLRLRLLE
jgi:mRNA interferase RelE/StbE